MNKKQRIAVFDKLKQANPNPKTELNYKTNFELLIAVILSAQATDISVNKATHYLFKKANTPAEILALGRDGLVEFIRTIGLFNTKADNILKTCHQLITLHQGEVPDNRAALEALPGVGRKTANVILNTLFKQPEIAVDTHIFRVANRTGLAKGKTVIEVEKGLLKVIPADYIMNAHHWLVLHGRYTCQARTPLCHQCVITSECDWFKKNNKCK